MVTRGRVMSAALNPKRPLIQLSGLADEQKTQVELFMPMGMSVYPTGNEDLILLQVGGSRSHLVALFADNPALRIKDLKAGEFGHRDTNGQQIVFRQDKLEITSPLKMQITVTGDVDIEVGGDVTGKAASWQLLKGDLTVSGNITADGNITSNKDDKDSAQTMAHDRSQYNQHTHPGGGLPDPKE